MSDVMFYGVLRMPYEMAMSGEISRRQFWSRAQEAADRVERLEAELARRATSGSDASLDMRAGFEKWMSDRGQAVGYQGDGLYAYRGVNEQADAFRAGVEFAVASGKASGSDGTTASVAVREGAWDWKQRAEAAEAFIKPYADANNEYLAGDYSVQPMVRRLAAAILEWQTDVLKHAPDDVCGVETEASGSELVKLKAAIDSTFPETDSAHTSVQMRRTDQRNAFRLGWEQARAAVAQQAGVMAPSQMKEPSGAAPAPATQSEQDAKDAALEEAAAVFESAAKHNASKGRTVFAHEQQQRADRMRAAMSQSKTQEGA